MATKSERRIIGLRHDIFSLILEEARLEFAHEKPDASKQARLLLREAITHRASRKASQPPADLSTPKSGMKRHTLNIRQDCWALVEREAKRDFPHETPDIARQTRILLMEAIGARQAARIPA